MSKLKWPGLKVKGRFIVRTIMNVPDSGKPYDSYDIYLKTADSHQFVAEFQDRLPARIACRALEDARKVNCGWRRVAGQIIRRKRR